MNVPDTLGDPYNMRKSDNDRVAESYIKDYIFKLSSYLDSIGLSELYGYYQPIKKLDKFSLNASLSMIRSKQIPHLSGAAMIHLAMKDDKSSLRTICGYLSVSFASRTFEVDFLGLFSGGGSTDEILPEGLSGSFS